MNHSGYVFFKYEGTGNDFILIDDRQNRFPDDKALIRKLCARKTGIGSDGLILIRKSEKAAFRMEFFNPDGSQSFCGNGGRAAVHFAHRIGITGKQCSFTAIDGIHRGELTGENRVRISMKDVKDIKINTSDLVLDTGSPHYVRFVDDLEKENIIKTGRAIRYSGKFAENGINVNLAEKIAEQTIKCRTYERGVEDETLSCGTGVTAVALAACIMYHLPSPVTVKTPGGELKVTFEQNGQDFSNITLEGPVNQVYKGEISC